MSELVIRQAVENDAEALWSLIHTHQREGHLLPRELSELRRHASRFLVAENRGECELVDLVSHRLASAA